VLLSAGPLALVLAAVLPAEATHTMALVFLKVTVVLLAVGPPELALSVHLVVDPLSLVLLAIAPEISARATNFVQLEFSIVNGSVGKGQLAAAVLLSFVV